LGLSISPAEVKEPPDFNISPIRAVFANELVSSENTQKAVGRRLFAHLIATTRDGRKGEEDIEKKTYTDVKCFCVTYLREVLGVNIRGDAHTIPANSKPIKGGVVLLNTSDGSGHAALIVDFTPEGYRVKESNWKKCQPGTRVIPYNDPLIRGFYVG